MDFVWLYGLCNKRGQVTKRERARVKFEQDPMGGDDGSGIKRSWIGEEKDKRQLYCWVNKKSVGLDILIAN